MYQCNFFEDPLKALLKFFEKNKLAQNLVEDYKKNANYGAGDGIRTHDPNLGKVVLYP